MQKMMDETSRRREKQLAYNEKNNITPKQINKSQSSKSSLQPRGIGGEVLYYTESEKISIAADPVVQYMSKDQLKSNIEKSRKAMDKAAKELDFVEAARLRDEMFELQKLHKEKFGG